jgi:hypothetical protein
MLKMQRQNFRMFVNMYLIGNQNYYIWTAYLFFLTEPNRTEFKSKKIWKKNQVKTKKTEPNWFLFKNPNQTETSQFEPISVRFRFLKKKIRFVYFFIKTKPNRKWLSLVKSG